MLDVYKQALARNEKLIASVAPDQLSGSTPCAEFDVKALIGHIIGGNYFIKSMAEGAQFDETAVAGLIGPDLVESFRKSADAVTAAVSEPANMERTWQFPFGEMPGAMGMGIAIMEAYVHGWDLAKATGQDASIPDQVAEMILAGFKMKPIADDLRKPEAKAFAPEVKVPETASATDRLVAYLGRTP